MPKLSSCSRRPTSALVSVLAQPVYAIKSFAAGLQMMHLLCMLLIMLFSKVVMDLQEIRSKEGGGSTPQGSHLVPEGTRWWHHTTAIMHTPLTSLAALRMLPRVLWPMLQPQFGDARAA